MAFWNRKREETITVQEHEAIVRECRTRHRQELQAERDTVARLVRSKMGLLRELEDFKAVRAKHVAALDRGRETQARRKREAAERKGEGN